MSRPAKRLYSRVLSHAEPKCHTVSHEPILEREPKNQWQTILPPDPSTTPHMWLDYQNTSRSKVDWECSERPRSVSWSLFKILTQSVWVFGVQAKPWSTNLASFQQAHKPLPFTVRRSAIQQIALRLANAWMRRFVWSLDSHAVPSCAFSKNVFDSSCWDLTTLKGFHSSDICQSKKSDFVLTTVASSYSKVWIVFGYLSNAALPGPLHL